MGSRRRGYTLKEKMSMVQFLYDEHKKGNKEAEHACGDKIWKLAYRKKILNQTHSYQSMRDHMRRQILPNLHEIPLAKWKIEELANLYNLQLPAQNECENMSHFRSLRQEDERKSRQRVVVEDSEPVEATYDVQINGYSSGDDSTNESEDDDDEGDAETNSSPRKANVSIPKKAAAATVSTTSNSPTKKTSSECNTTIPYKLAQQGGDSYDETCSVYNRVKTFASTTPKRAAAAIQEEEETSLVASCRKRPKPVDQDFPETQAFNVADRQESENEEKEEVGGEKEEPIELPCYFNADDVVSIKKTICSLSRNVDDEQFRQGAFNYVILSGIAKKYNIPKDQAIELAKHSDKVREVEAKIVEKKKDLVVLKKWDDFFQIRRT